MNDDAVVFLNRLDRLMELRGLNKHTLSEACGIPYSTIVGFYKKDASRIKLPTIRKLAKFFDCSMDYLVGNADDLGPIGQSEQIADTSDPDDTAHPLASAYENAPPTVKEIVDVALKPFMEDPAPEPEPEEDDFVDPDDIETCKLPYYDAPPAAGRGNYFGDSPVYPVDIALPVDRVPTRASFCVRISGTSMEPDYPDQSLVFVESCPTIESGEVGVFVLNDRGVIKKLHIEYSKPRRVSLVSINPDGPTHNINKHDDLYTLGRVVGIMEKEEADQWVRP